MLKMCIFLDKFDPSCQLHIALAGGGGAHGEKKLDSRVLLALRQLPRLAEGGAYRVCRVCVKLAGAAQSIF
jgi:hypothetical protein